MATGERHDITLVFSHSDGKVVKKGPFASFCLQGETLRDCPGGTTFAVHEDHEWIVDGKTFSRVDCDCRVEVRLERVDGKRSEEYGPFESFSCMDGIAHVDHELFAVADRSIGDWYCHRDGKHWPIIIVKAR